MRPSNASGFPRSFPIWGLARSQIHRAALLVIGRLLHPARERESALWGKEISALEELLDADFRHLSNNVLYRTSDQLVEHREEIERLLAERERELFRLGEKIFLYDLTNTYLAGRAHESSRAHHGRSKQKRDDCPLLTLALVLDEDGFPKASQLLPGNVSESGTLRHFLEAFKAESESQPSIFKEAPTVVIDAGIGTEKNLELISEEGFHYICVSRSRPKETPEEGLVVIKEDKGSTIEVKRLGHNGEALLYCRSSARARKEEAIKTRFRKHFEEGLQSIASSLTKRRGEKSYEKVMERLG